MIENLLSDNWFKQHPDKTLGDVKSVIRYGAERAVVQSKETVEEIAAKIIGDLPKPEIQPWHLGLKAPEKEVKADKIEQALRKTEDEIQNPPSNKGHEMISFEALALMATKTDAPKNGEVKNSRPITDEERRVWTWYNRGKMFSDSAILQPDNGWSNYVTPLSEIKGEKLTEWVEAGYVAFDGVEYMPSILFYSGNIYERINKMVQRKETIVEKIGALAYANQLQNLQDAKPEPLKISAPEDERLYISPLDPFVKNNYISRLGDGTIFENETSLLNAFIIWLDTLSATDFKNGSNSYEITNYYLGDERHNKNTSPEERLEIARRSQQDCISLFNRFTFEALTREDQQILEHLWNSEYNSFKEYDYSRIPLGFEINRYFNNAPVDPRPTLWDGVKFLSANGSGIVAFDVGVGKTMTAILAVGQALYTGQCKRPLIVVPNPTYKKWITECVGAVNPDGTIQFHGILPQYRDRINDYYNLGVDYEKKLQENYPKDYTITFVTFEGLMKIGFGQAAKEKLESQLFTILNQGLDGRDAQKLREDIDEILGGVTSDTIADIDDLGFDYIVVDEAHNFKKIFTRVKGRVDESDKERQVSPYQISSGEPSGRGLKLFAIAQHILMQNAMRNVVLLTATPFTNSPLEIYSMLALVAYQKLEKRGITNLIDFFDKFINEEIEQSITVKGTIEPKSVIKSFNNRQVLQNIIFSSIIYKTGEEAGVPRPTKIVYPYIKDPQGIFLPPDKVVETRLQPTADQEYWLKQIAAFANDAPENVIEPFVPDRMYDDKGRLLGRTLIAIGLAANCTLSPHLMRIGGEDGVKLYDEPAPGYLEFIDSAPKLKYVMECIRTVKQHHEAKGEPVSGQVIYMNMATGYFPFIKQYLVEQIGYKAAEVEIISGGMPQPKKERIKEKFLAGEIKIIIGSATIREGIDLQKRSTVLYNCAMDWNPTDIQQLEGRIWRQGNIHSYVRIVTPLIENSLDVFMFQKLEEKTARINNIWYRKGRGNVLKLEDFDPQELKLGLMTDPVERAKTEIKIEVSALEREKKIVEDNAAKLTDAQRAIKETLSGQTEIDRLYIEKRPFLQNQFEALTLELKDEELSKTERDRLESQHRNLGELLARPVDEKVKIAVIKRWARKHIQEHSQYWQSKDAYTAISLCDDMLKNFSMMDAIQKNILAPKNLTLADDLTDLITEYSTKAAELNEQIKNLTSTRTLQDRQDKIKAELMEKKNLSRPLMYRVDEFKRHNYLLSCLKDVHECSLESSSVKTKAKKQEKPTPASLPGAGATAQAIQQRIDALLAAYEALGEESIKTRIEALELSLEIL